MLLSAKPIINWSNVNMYSFGNQWTINAGDPLILYFQLIDTDQAVQGNNGFFGNAFSGIAPVGTTAGLRYLAGIGAANQPYSVNVTFPSIDIASKYTFVATQVDSNDSSIWQVKVPASAILTSGNVNFALSEGGYIKRFSVLNMIAVQNPTNNGSC